MNVYKMLNSISGDVADIKSDVQVIKQVQEEQKIDWEQWKIERVKEREADRKERDEILMEMKAITDDLRDINKTLTKMCEERGIHKIPTWEESQGILSKMVASLKGGK